MVKSDRKRASFYIGVVLVTLFAMLCVIPLIYMICVSFAHTSTMYIKFDDIDFTDFSNYIYLFVNKDFGRPLLNSLIVVVASVIVVDLVSCTMAYGFEKKPIPGKKPMFNMVLATMMIPTQVVFISLYVMMRKANMLNTYVALVIPLVGAFGVFIRSCAYICALCCRWSGPRGSPSPCSPSTRPGTCSSGPSSPPPRTRCRP